MFPPVLLMQPEVARSLLQYRFDRIPAAEAKAKAYTTGYNKGLKGSMFPWQSVRNRPPHESQAASSYLLTFRFRR